MCAQYYAAVDAVARRVCGQYHGPAQYMACIMTVSYAMGTCIGLFCCRVPPGVVVFILAGLALAEHKLHQRQQAADARRNVWLQFPDPTSVTEPLLDCADGLCMIGA